MPALPIRVVHLPVEFVTRGTLQPWLGPAVRGMVLCPLMEHMCILDPHDRAIRLARMQHEIEPRYCQGCEKNAECSYGRIWEPDRKLIDGFVRGGMRDGLRALTIGAIPLSVDPSSPLKPQVATLRVLAAGELAIRNLDTVVDMVSKQGESVGLGRESIRFRVIRQHTSVQDCPLNFDELPLVLDRETVPEVTLDLQTPLLLKIAERQENSASSLNNHRSFSRRFTFRDLLSNSVRTVRRAINEFADSEWSRSTNLSSLFEGLESIELSETGLRPFSQSRTSLRKNGARWDLNGFQGQVTCYDINAAYLPWLRWAGVLGVGDSRNCSAGVWKISGQLLVVSC